MSALAIIPTYLREPIDAALLTDCIYSLRATAPDVELLIVDDGSPAHELVDELDAQAGDWNFTVTRRPVNAGFSQTVNVGLRQALEHGQDAVLVNADIVFTQPWLELMDAQLTSDGCKPASVVGGLLLYPNGLIQHAGIFFCSPGDEPVLTASDGYVPLRDLQSGHGLVSYSRQENKIVRKATRAGRWRPGVPLPNGGGYGFEIESHRFVGNMLSLGTANGTARVTPNHKMTAFWTERALASWGVYLMCRGGDWRIGHSKITHGRSRAFGPRLRMCAEGADAAWLLRIFDNKQDAVAYEMLTAWTYGVPTLLFRAHGELDQRRLDDFWLTIDSATGARAVLVDHGRYEDLPLVAAASGRRQPTGPQRRYSIHAGNLMPGYMRLPTDDGGQAPAVLDFMLDAESFDGPGYSRDVHPHEHYISGGVVVHNSLLSRCFDHIYRYAPGDLPEAQHARCCPVTGALQFIRHECLADIGVYDEQFRMGHEDVDYCIRAFQSGRECVMQPRVQAIHHESVFRGRPSPKIADWQQRSWIYFMRKYASTSFAQYVPSVI